MDNLEFTPIRESTKSKGSNKKAKQVSKTPAVKNKKVSNKPKKVLSINKFI